MNDIGIYDLYEASCKNCQRKTNHMIIRVSRKSGVLLKCLKCGQSRTRYAKVHTLIRLPEAQQNER